MRRNTALFLLLSSLLAPALFAAGTITTVAGTGSSGSSGLGGPATSAQLGTPAGMVVDAAGNTYIVEYSNNRVTRVDASTGILSLFAGNGTNASTGDGGPAAQASLSGPTTIARDG